MTMSDRLIVTNETITIPHIGITVRTLLSAAAEASRAEGRHRRRYRISYVNVIIGSIRIANDREDMV